MEQRAREMGKTSEAAVYRKFINSMKKKTKEMNEEKKTENVKQDIITAIQMKNVNQSPRVSRWLVVPDIFVKRMVIL